MLKVYEFMNKGQKIRGKQISSFASLHSKTMVFDEKVSWIGSFNLDPRSILLNSEVVAVFENETFAKELVQMIKKDIKNSWELKLLDGETVWIAKDENGNEIIEHKSPDTTFFKRLITKILKMFHMKVWNIMV